MLNGTAGEWVAGMMATEHGRAHLDRALVEATVAMEWLELARQFVEKSQASPDMEGPVYPD